MCGKQRSQENSHVWLWSVCKTDVIQTIAGTPHGGGAWAQMINADEYLSGKGDLSENMDLSNLSIQYPQG